jgi:hypothetical protein
VQAKRRYAPYDGQQQQRGRRGGQQQQQQYGDDDGGGYNKGGGGSARGARGARGRRRQQHGGEAAGAGDDVMEDVEVRGLVSGARLREAHQAAHSSCRPRTNDCPTSTNLLPSALSGCPPPVLSKNVCAHACLLQHLQEGQAPTGADTAAGAAADEPPPDPAELRQHLKMAAAARRQAEEELPYEEVLQPDDDWDGM